MSLKPSWMSNRTRAGCWPRAGLRAKLHYVLAGTVISVLLCGYWLFAPPDMTPFTNPTSFEEYLLYRNDTRHPIDQLITDSHQLQRNLLRERSHDLESAARRYRERRGRHPPPGFDAWFQYAKDHDAVIVESFFDRIEKDISPYWALDPELTALRAATWLNVVSVRDGAATGTGPIKKWAPPWLQLWTDLVDEAAPHLPDVDMPFNYLDESRVMVPWEDINSYVKIERANRSVLPVDQAVTTYTGLSRVDAVRDSTAMYEPEWITTNYWDVVRAACPPDSPSRNVEQYRDFSQRPVFPSEDNADYQYRGYVRNFTATLDMCVQPHMRGLHAALVEPGAMSTSPELIPMFGGCKLLSNNEILIPGAMYLTDSARIHVSWSLPKYSVANSWSIPWREKAGGVAWRGLSTGGNTTVANWQHLQRIRLVEMLDGHAVSRAEAEDVIPHSFDLPSEERYPELLEARSGNMGTWIESMSNAGFTRLICLEGEDSDCSYMQDTFTQAGKISFGEFFKYKFLPDVDGNSFSGRYRSFVQSTSLPIKSTIYAEWHDDRLIPWLHFVPMDNTHQDLYGILDYFTRDKKGDKAAQYIAEQGAIWGGKVLRREDMLLYTWRVLLEWARVCDVNRERLGYVGDLS